MQGKPCPAIFRGLKAIVVSISLISLLLCGCADARESAQESASAQDSASARDFASAQGAELHGERLSAPINEVDIEKHPLSFLFVSDSQADPQIGDYTDHGELLNLGIGWADKPSLVVFGGDTVNDGGDPDEWAAFHEATKRLLSDMTTAREPFFRIVTAAVAGNHDGYALLAEQFDYPEDVPAGPGDGYFYAFEMGGVFFIMLDSNTMGAARQKDIDWLRGVLDSEASRKAAWRVAVMHHPMWPVMDNPKDMARAKTMREHFLPLLEAGGVSLLLCGHQHIYTRTAPMHGEGADSEGEGIVQIMAASGGKQSYVIGEKDFIVRNAGAPNAVLVIADEDALKVSAYDDAGLLFDTFTLEKQLEK
jgi:3',5'-cyclic AMP phosphodiesterase CpdA